MKQAWKCTVTGYENDILSNPCKFCENEYRPPELADLAVIITFQRLGVPMADYADLFNKHRNRVREMTDEELIATRQEAADIAHTARIIQIASTEEINERKAKNKAWSVPSTDINVQKSIGEVKERRTRMKKDDKVAAVLKNLGIANAADILASINKGTTPPTLRVDLNAIEVKEKKAFDPESLKGLVK